MIDSLLKEIFEKADEWHNSNLTIFKLDNSPPHIKLLYHNYQTWHLIDLYKTNPDKVPYDNHGITHNKLRNYAISELDESLSCYQKGTGKMHSETIGDIIDKITILYIKLLHVNEDKKKSVKQHFDLLVLCVKDLFEEVCTGTRQCPKIERFKV